MSDDKTKPLDDLKQGLGLLFRAARGAAEVAADAIPSGKLEEAAREAAREVGRALETVGGEIDKAWSKATGSSPPAGAAAPPPAPPAGETPPAAAPYDDAYAPDDDGSRGPRVG